MPRRVTPWQKQRRETLALFDATPAPPQNSRTQERRCLLGKQRFFGSWCPLRQKLQLPLTRLRPQRQPACRLSELMSGIHHTLPLGIGPAARVPQAAVSSTVHGATTLLLDHLVGAGNEHWRDIKGEGSGGSEI